MKVITLHHGSDHIIEHPKFGLGRPHNDYGRGFYCTESPSLAKEWAVDIDRDGYCNTYTLLLDGLRILRLNGRKFSILSWLAILIENRTFDSRSPLEEAAKEYLHEHFLPKDYRDYDVIIGYRADDSYFGYASSFLRGGLSLRQLSYAMKLGKLGEQVVLISEKAFSQLSFVKAEEAKADEFFFKKKNRDLLAREKYQNSTHWSYSKDDLYIQDILREGIEDGDPRLF